MKKNLAYPIFLFVLFMTPLLSIGGGVPQFKNVALPANGGIKYDMYEIVFTTDQEVAGSANPYDPTQFNYYAEFWSPSGKYYKVNAFYFNGVDDNGCALVHQQTLTLNTVKNWKVRFTPNETSGINPWRCRLTAQNIFGTTQYPGSSGYLSFWCTTQTASLSNKGFIKKANERYLKFDDGSPFIPVGDNAPWWEHTNGVFTPGDPRFIEDGSCGTKVYIDEMVQNNENFFVFDVNIFDHLNLFGPDYRDGKNYYSYFNQLDSWQLDDIMNYAHQYGIYLDLAIFAHCNLGNLVDCANTWSLYNPFNSFVSLPTTYPDIAGTSNTPFDFLTDPGALQIQKNLLRYIVARWGYSNNVMSWELLDEVDQFNHSYEPDFSGGQAALTKNIANWHASTKTYINSVDPQQHLVCTGNFALSPDTSYAMNHSMDFVISKRYTSLGPSHADTIWGWVDQDFEKVSYDIANAFNTKYYAPFFMVETGYFADNWGLLPEYDPTMYGLHGLLWSSLFSGAMGPSCFWTHWEITYNKPLANANFKGIGTFTKNSLPLLSEDYLPVFDNEQASGLKLYYLKNINSDVFYGWAQDKNYDFKKILRSTIDLTLYPPGTTVPYNYLPPPPKYLQDLATDKPDVSVPGNNDILFSVGKNGVYDVTWYNTETGALELATTAKSASNSITISIPYKLRTGKYGDAAFKVEYRCDGQWNATVLNENEPSNALVGSDIETTSIGNVYFVANDNRVHIMFYNGFYWNDAPLNTKPGIVRANSDLARDRLDKVNYIATDNKVHQYWWNGSVWIEAALCTATRNTARANSPLVCDNNSSVYYFAAVDDKVHNYWWDETHKTWIEADLNTKVPARKDSDITIDYLGNIFYIGADSRIYRCYYSETGWVNSLIAEDAQANVKAGSALACDATGSVYYIGNERTNGRIHRFKKASGIWREENFAPNTPTNTIKAGSDLTVGPNGSVYFVGTDNRMHNYWQCGAEWVEATLNINDPPNVSRYIASDAIGNIFYNSNNVNGCGNKIYADYYGCQSQFKSLEDNSASEELTEITKDATINVYPNPNNGKFKIQFSINDASEKLDIKIYDVMGRIVFEKTAYNITNEIEINLSEQLNGIYFARIIGENKWYSKRFNIVH